MVYKRKYVQVFRNIFLLHVRDHTKYEEGKEFNYYKERRKTIGRGRRRNWGKEGGTEERKQGRDKYRGPCCTQNASQQLFLDSGQMARKRTRFYILIFLFPPKMNYRPLNV